MMSQVEYRAEALKALLRSERATTAAERRSWADFASSWNTLAETAVWQDAFAIAAAPALA
jgi:hypothetical protein